MYTNRLSEMIAVLSVEHADSLAPGTYTGTGWVQVGSYHRLWVVCDVGDMVQGATFDLALQQAQDAIGTGAVGIGAKAGGWKQITQLTANGGDGNEIVMIECQTEELDVDNSFDFVRFLATVGNSNVEASIILYGESPRFPPVPLTLVSEVID